jgi:hypothetical protein
MIEGTPQGDFALEVLFHTHDQSELLYMAACRRWEPTLCTIALSDNVFGRRRATYTNLEVKHNWKMGTR